jgi:hypothetical protein
VEEVDGMRLYRASNAKESRLVVAFVCDGDGAVAHLIHALALLGDTHQSWDVACTAWIAGPHQQALAGVLDADTVHNWSVLCAHSLSSCETTHAAGGEAVVLTIARHRPPL